MALHVTVTQAQFTTLKNALGPQAILVYQRNPTDATLTGLVAMLDTKLGVAVAAWTDLAETPTETAFLASYPAAIRVEDLAGSHG